MDERESIVSVWIGNLGKYNEGELVGEWLGFPCSKEEFDAVLKRIGIGSMRKENDARYGIYKEYFAKEYKESTGIFYIRYGKYPDWKELNILAGILDTFDDDQINAISTYLEEVTDVEWDEFYTIIANIAERRIYLNSYTEIEDKANSGYFESALYAGCDLKFNSYGIFGSDALNDGGICFGKRGLLNYFNYDSSLGLNDLDIGKYDWDAEESDLSNEAKIADAQAKETNESHKVSNDHNRGER